MSLSAANAAINNFLFMQTYGAGLCGAVEAAVKERSQ